MIRTIRPLDRPDPALERVAKAYGFSLHAGVNCEGKQKDKRERLCRYIARPAVAVARLSLSSTDKVVYTLKTPYRDGTTQAAFEPVDFIARLAALVPKPRVNLTRYHGVLAPNHRCGGSVRVIACIEDQEIIDRILAHLRDREQDIPTVALLTPPTGAPPETLPLFAGKDSSSTAFNQQGRHWGIPWYRVVRARFPR